MTITSLQFLLFALLAVVAVQAATAVRHRGARAVALLAFNLWFFASFATGGVLQLVPMAAFMALGYVVVRSLHAPRAARRLAWTIALVLVVFFWLKRYTFVPESLWITTPYVTLGLSYILFRVLQLVIDARDDETVGTIGPVAYVNYLLNFPAFISGPIQRYQEWAEQDRAPLAVDWTSLAESIERIVVGVFKVVVVGPVLLGWHQAALRELAPQMSAVDRGLHGAAIAGFYAIYLFLNFSGYTDIVIGLARLLGMRLPENFNRPFSATSFLDFWARWHMSLSNWLKTYVYSPVVKALMQRYPQRSVEPYIGVVAFFVTFFLIGLWHGQTLVFALYGFLLGLGVSGNKLHQIRMNKRLGKKRYAALGRRVGYQAFGRGLTFLWFAISLVCFWATWPQIEALCASLGPAGFAVAALVLFVSAGVLFTVVDRVRGAALGVRVADTTLFTHRYLRTVFVTAIAFVAIAAMVLMSGPAPDIVYKNF